MAIKGLTDRQPRLPTIGQLRKGAQKGRGPGRDLDYFRFTTDDQEAAQAFKEAYGDEPREIQVYLPYKTTDLNMSAWREHWVSGGLRHRCDGEMTVQWRLEGGELITEPGQQKPCPGQCKPVGRLEVLIPQLERFATVTALTTSINDIVNLTRQLRAYETLQGDLRRVPFILSRVQVQVSTPGSNGKRGRRPMWLLSIETDPGHTQALIDGMTGGDELAPPTEEESADQIVTEAREAIEEIQAEMEQSPGIDHPSDYPGPSEDIDLNDWFDDPEAELAREESGGDLSRGGEMATAQMSHGLDFTRPWTPDNFMHKKEEFITSCLARGVYLDPEEGTALPIQYHDLKDRTPQVIAAQMTKALKESEAQLAEDGLTYTDAYHQVLYYFFGRDSAKDLSAPEAAFILRWLHEGQDFDRDHPFDCSINETAKVEIKVLYAHSVAELG